MLAETAPALRPPTTGAAHRAWPRISSRSTPDSSPSGWRRRRPRRCRPTSPPGTVAVLAPGVAGGRAGPRPRRRRSASATDPRRDGLGAPLSLLPVDLANGLEFDAVVVVEPAAIVEESPQGLRALYVALTRPTRRLAVVHARPLPAALRPDEPPTAPDRGVHVARVPPGDRRRGGAPTVLARRGRRPLGKTP